MMIQKRRPCCKHPKTQLASWHAVKSKRHIILSERPQCAPRRGRSGLLSGRSMHFRNVSSQSDEGREGLRAVKAAMMLRDNLCYLEELSPRRSGGGRCVRLLNLSMEYRTPLCKIGGFKSTKRGAIAGLLGLEKPTERCIWVLNMMSAVKGSGGLVCYPTRRFEDKPELLGYCLPEFIQATGQYADAG